MALKDGARSWLLNLQHGSISSWDEMCDRFVANFQGTRDRPPAAGDLRRVKQQPGEDLQKYIQRFNNTRLKIPKVTDEAIISAFSDDVRDVKMKEELAIHEELCTSQELFNLATKCARAEEGRLSLLELPAAGAEGQGQGREVQGGGGARSGARHQAGQRSARVIQERPTVLRLPQPEHPQHQRLSRAQSHMGRTLRSTPRAQRPGLWSWRRMCRRTLGRPWPAPGVARQAS